MTTPVPPPGRAVLAIACADIAGVSTAVLAEGRVLAIRHLDDGRRAIEMLAPMVQEVVREGCTSFSGIGVVAVTNGPGSFSGLRTGLGLAAGLGLLPGLRLLAFSVLQLTAFAALDGSGTDRIVALHPAPGGRLHLQVFDGGMRALTPPAALDRETAAALCAGATRVAGSGDGHPPADAGTLARLAWHHAGKGQESPCPLYLHLVQAAPRWR